MFSPKNGCAHTLSDSISKSISVLVYMVCKIKQLVNRQVCLTFDGNSNFRFDCFGQLVLKVSRLLITLFLIQLTPTCFCLKEENLR